MDFHSLARRDLQALCKKNKIPANMTNVAMADALQALETVEGIEEFLNPSGSEIWKSSFESPERSVKTTSNVPRTGCRTSARRKAIQEEPKGSLTMTRTRRGTRRAIAEEVENPKLDLPATPAIPSGRRRVTTAAARGELETQSMEHGGDEKNVPETPAATTNRRQGTVASTRRTELTRGDQKEATPVLQVYSSRRTTRLLEKKLMELNLNNDEEREPVKVEASDKELPNQRIVEEDSDNFGKALEVKGTHEQTVSDDILTKTEDSEEALDERKSDVLQENAREVEDDVQDCMGDNKEVGDSKVKPDQVAEVFDESDLVMGSDEHMDTLTIEKNKAKGVDSEVYEENKEDDDSQTRPGSRLEKCIEPDILSGKNLDKSLASEEEMPEKEGCDHSGSDTFVTETSNPNEYYSDEEGLNAGYDLGLKDSDAVDVLQPRTPEETNHQLLSEEPVADDLVNESSAETETAGDPLEEGLIDSDQFVSEELLISETLNDGEQSNQLAIEPSNEDGSDTVESVTVEPAIQVAVDASGESMNLDNLVGAADPVTVSHPSVDSNPCPMIPSPADPLVKSPRQTSFILDYNKENIDNSAKKLDFTKDLEKKDKKNTADISLRQLRKMFREKCQVANNVNTMEEMNIAKAGKARPALQALSENRMAAIEPENEK